MACAVGPEPRLQASRKRSLKALFASLFLPRVGLGEGVRFLYCFFLGHKHGESNPQNVLQILYIYMLSV